MWSERDRCSKGIIVPNSWVLVCKIAGGEEAQPSAGYTS